MSAKGGYGGGILGEVAGMEPRWHGWGHGGGHGKLMGMVWPVSIVEFGAYDVVG